MKLDVIYLNNSVDDRRLEFLGKCNLIATYVWCVMNISIHSTVHTHWPSWQDVHKYLYSKIFNYKEKYYYVPGFKYQGRKSFFVFFKCTKQNRGVVTWQYVDVE